MSSTSRQTIDVSSPGRDRIAVKGPGGAVYEGVVKTVRLDSGGYDDYSYRGSGGGLNMGSLGGYGPTDMTIEVAIDGRAIGEFVSDRPQRRGKGSAKKQTKKKENTMKSKFKIIVDEKTKTVNVYCPLDEKADNGNELYLATDGAGGFKKTERPKLSEMPLYATFDLDDFKDLVKAGVEAGLDD